MMRGTKRSAVSDSAPVSNSNEFMSKRAVMESMFTGHKAEPSIQSTPLDLQRAKLSRQHVRALNAQFASWVQDQLHNHPDELWEDGIQDYLNHAKSIMEKFSDVVSWLKANTAKKESSPGIHSDATLVKCTSDIDKSSHKSSLPTPLFATAATTSFVPSWSAGALPNTNTTFSFGGSQLSIPGSANSLISNHNSSNDADGEDVEQPSSPSVKRSEEKGILVVHEVKCKLYVKSADPGENEAWKDKGMGQLSIKCKEGISKGTKESKPNIIIRNDVGKVVLNALLYPGIKTNKQKNSIIAIFHTLAEGENNDDVVTRTFLIKTKNEDDRDKLAAAIQDYAPAA